MQWLGWAPQPTQKQGKYDWFGPAVQGYQQGMEQYNQRQDFPRLGEPGFNPASQRFMDISAQQKLAAMGPQTPLDQSRANYYNSAAEANRQPPYKETPERENARNTYLSDLENRYKENELSKPEFIERVNKFEQFFRNPNYRNVTPQEIESFYLSLEPTKEKQKSLMDRLLGPKSTTNVSPSSLSSPQIGFGSGMNAETKDYTKMSMEELMKLAGPM